MTTLAQQVVQARAQADLWTGVPLRACNMFSFSEKSDDNHFTEKMWLAGDSPRYLAIGR